MAARRLLTPEQALVLRMLAWCRDFALLLAYKTVSDDAFMGGGTYSRKFTLFVFYENLTRHS